MIKATGIGKAHGPVNEEKMGIILSFNQPEIGRRLNKMWPEDLIR
jgi:hypothetical protein